MCFKFYILFVTPVVCVSNCTFCLQHLWYVFQGVYSVCNTCGMCFKLYILFITPVVCVSNCTFCLQHPWFVFQIVHYVCNTCGMCFKFYVLFSTSVMYIFHICILFATPITCVANLYFVHNPYDVCCQFRSVSNTHGLWFKRTEYVLVMCVLVFILFLISSHLGFVHPLQDVALHQCLPSSSVCCLPNPGGSLLLCYVILPSSAWSSSRPLPSPWLPLCASPCPPIVL